MRKVSFYLGIKVLLDGIATFDRQMDLTRADRTNYVIDAKGKAAKDKYDCDSICKKSVGS